ncbi:unnamed protein product [Urochloa humidicola]
MARAIVFVALALLPVELTTAAASTGADYRRQAPSLGHKCGAQGTYAPGSAYEANLRRLAAFIYSSSPATQTRTPASAPPATTPASAQTWSPLRSTATGARTPADAGLRGGAAALPVPPAGHGRG